MPAVQTCLRPIAPEIAPAAHAWLSPPRLVDADATHAVTVLNHPIAFEQWVTPSEIEDWTRLVTARRWVMTTIGQVFAGAWSYDRLLVILPNYAGMEPTMCEVWDLGTRTDNGHILLVMQQDRWVHPDTLVFLEGADATEKRPTRLHVEPAPDWTDMGHTGRLSPLVQVGRGCLCVTTLPDDSSRFMVFWRRDARGKFGLGLSVHENVEAACKAMEIIAARMRRGDIPTPDTYHRVRYDRQRAKVYRWDDVLLARFLSLSMTLDQTEAQQWADHVCRVLGMPQVTVNFNDRLQRKCYYNGGRIELAKWGRNIGTLIHEIGHHCVRHDRTCTVGVESHGPEYVGWLMRLLELVPGVAMDVAQEEAKALGIQWRD